MLGVTDLPTYVIGTIAIILLPGPNSMFVLATAAQRGVRAGYRAVSGVFLGDAILMVATALGVASLLRAFPPVYTALKYAGAAYLAYLGVRMLIGAVKSWRQRGEVAAAVQEVAEPHPFRRAFIVSIINPKAILFLISFFTQFVDPAYPHPAITFLVLGVILQITSLIYLSALIFAGTYLAAQFERRKRLAAAGTSAVGALFLGFSLKLATSSMT
ncbi:leucine efflux protein [Allocatelliglobosispora scoriae]|uniref:Leucine efflux protein n=2 Tax=Allocatelliglobosispora scoriae TaxID=643052 RepID=A0A841BZV0_9ACTN|nr:leucine efflux protein [Allocatelliglobosispora scoriae]